jgi:hypothetical protein
MVISVLLPYSLGLWVSAEMRYARLKPTIDIPYESFRACKVNQGLPVGSWSCQYVLGWRPLLMLPPMVLIVRNVLGLAFCCHGCG